MATLKVGTEIEIRENHKPLYKIFGSKGKIKSVNTTCQQYNQTERTEYYDVEVISLLSRKLEIMPVKKIHVIPLKGVAIHQV